jgi:hypothetical protein
MLLIFIDSFYLPMASGFSQIYLILEWGILCKSFALLLHSLPSVRTRGRLRWTSEALKKALCFF